MSLNRIVGRGHKSPRELNGTAPITDSDSKNVMLRAERNDRLRIYEVVRRFSQNTRVPGQLSVLQRKNPYYGPVFLLHAEFDNQNFNYQLSAPGPDSYLYLWAAKTDADGFRKAWYKLAEVKVEFAENQPTYDICSDCGKPIKTLEHERYSAFGQCANN